MSARPEPRSADPEVPRIVVVGGGITGLCAAHALLRLAGARGLALDLRLFEEAPRLGGQIRTERQDGFLLEGGPDSLLARKPAARMLCERLGLDDQLLRVDRSRPPLQVVHRGRLVHPPAGLRLLAPTRLWPLWRSPLFSLRGKSRIALEPLIPRRHGGADESVGAFVTRRLGREAYERLAEPILGGLFTADAERLSVRMTVPRLARLEDEQGSLIRGLRRSGAADADGFFTLQNGLGSLVERLAAGLPRGAVALGSAVTAIERAADGSWLVRSAGGEALSAAAVILALPAHRGAGLLAQLDPPVAADLDALPYASCATVNLAYDPATIGRPLESHGFFVPRRSGLPILACSYVSLKFEGRAPAGKVLLRAFMGGALHPDLLEQPDSALIALAHRALAGLLALEGGPLLARVQRCPRSMPQFPVGYAERLAGTVARLARSPGLVLSGGALGAVGLPDCIRSGEQAAEQALEHAAARRCGSLQLA